MIVVFFIYLANATYTGDTVLGEEGYPQVRLHNYNLDWIDFRGYNIRISTDARTCDTMTETDYGDIDGGWLLYVSFDICSLIYRDATSLIIYRGATSLIIYRDAISLIIYRDVTGLSEVPIILTYV